MRAHPLTLLFQEERRPEINWRLEAASRHQSEFSANMSHTPDPLTLLIGFLEILLDESVGEHGPDGIIHLVDAKTLDSKRQYRITS